MGGLWGARKELLSIREFGRLLGFVEKQFRGLLGPLVGTCLKELLGGEKKEVYGKKEWGE